jgi:hypothetical protein
LKSFIYLVAGFAGFIAVGAALAGSAPQTVTVRQGCHGRQYALEAQESCGCHGQQMLAPAYSDAGCHGGRLTWGERRTARSAARANYRTTLAQFRDAGRQGASLQAIPVSAAPTMKMVPVEVECECKCNPCKCKK